MNHLSIWLLLVFWNFVYQFFAPVLPTNWLTAIDRSIFQGLAILACAWFCRPKKPRAFKTEADWLKHERSK